MDFGLRLAHCPFDLAYSARMEDGDIIGSDLIIQIMNGLAIIQKSKVWVDSFSVWSNLLYAVWLLSSKSNR